MKLYRRFSLCLLPLLLVLCLTGMGGKPSQNAAPLQEQATGPASPPAEAPAAAKADKARAPKAAVRADDIGALPATVTHISIMDRRAVAENKPLVITFSDPMVEADEIDKAQDAARMPFTLKPGVPGEGRWLTEKSFAFVPERGFRPGKSYAVLLKDKLLALDGRPVQFFFSFKTEAPTLNRLQPGAHDAANLRQTLHFDFSMPVSLTALAEHLSVTDAQSGKALTLDLTRAPERASSFAVVVELAKESKAIKVSLREDRDSDNYPLGFSQPQTVSVTLGADGGEAAVKDGERASSITLYNAYSSEETPGRMRVFFALDGSLQTHAQKEFIRVEPALPYTLNSHGDTLTFAEKVEPGTRITVTLLPGLTDDAGRVLKEARSLSHTVEDYACSASFAEGGSFLTPLYGSRVGLNLVNVDQVTVSLQRQYDNNLPFMAIDPDYNARRMMRDIAFKEIAVQGSDRNAVERRALDLHELAGGQKGVFLLTVRGYAKSRDSDGSSYMRYGNEEERLVVLTDIGVTARSFPSGITVFASSIGSAMPLADAEVRVFSASNQLIARGHTNRDGLFLHKRSGPWDPQLTPSVITVAHGSGEAADLTFLPLGGETGVYQEDTATRPYLDTGYEAFVYTPRGVFRPGERVDLKAFVRDAAHKAPAPFPVLFRIFSSRGLEAARGSVPLSDEGGAQFSFTLPTSAPTGGYSAVLEVPGQAAYIGSCTFSVEDFVPPRLEVAVAPSSKELVVEHSLSVILSGRYLFGAPGADLAYELGYRVSKKDFSPEGYADYAFGDREKLFDPQVSLRYLTGTLDSNGSRNIAFPVPQDWQAPALLDVKLIGSVQEDGGRWVTQTAEFVYYPTPWLLGLKLEGNELSPGRESRFNVVALAPDGEVADCGLLNIEISRVQSVWHTVYRNNRYVYTHDERLIPTMAMKAQSENGRAEFAFAPQQDGEYLVRVSSPDGSVVASRRFAAYGEAGQAGPEGGGRMDKVELSFDKDGYLPGETARLSVKAPYPGTLFLGLERGEQMSARVLHMEEAATTVDIPVSKDMAPSISVTAWVIRPVKEENREWYAHRAHGMIPLRISRQPHILNVSASTPERAAPSAPLSVPFTVTDDQGLPVEGEFSVALVDEGILSLTGFATPDPVRFFLAQRRAVGASYDAFDALLRPEARATPLLKPGGGAAESYQGSLSTQQVFLAGFLPTVHTDANGQAEAVFDIPEYSGKGRLMIVGASADRFASAASQVRVARDLVVESSAPRAVAPGDTFDLGVTLFALPTEGEAPLAGEARLTLSCEGPVTLEGELERLLPLTAPQAEAPAQGETAAQGENTLQADAPAQATAAPQGDAAPQGATAPQAEAPAQAEAKKQAAGAPLTHSLTFTAKAGDSADIARITVSVSVPGREDLGFSKTLEVAVRPPYPRTSAADSALLRAGESRELAPKGRWLPGKLASAVSLDRSPVIAVLPALEYLREYPYGCLEQVTSRAWPYLTLQEVQKAIDTVPGTSSSDTEANTVLSGVVSRIASMQTHDGGFSMWPGGSSPDPWKSVNATFFLLEAKSRVPVSAALLENALGYLRLLLAAPVESLGSTEEGYSIKAFAAFALTRAGEAPLGWVQHLAEQEKNMLPSGRIFLAGTRALKAGNPETLKALGGEAAPDDLQKIRNGYNRTMESALRNKSLLLYMWTLVAPLDESAKKLCLDTAAMLGASRYFSTQEAGMAALALGSYLEKTGGGSGSFKVSVSGPGIKPVSIEDDKAVTLASVETPLGEKGEVPPVGLSVEEGEVYAVYNVRGTPAQAPAPRSSGISVSRVWKDASGEVIDLSTGKASLNKGDRIIAELTIRAERPVSDVALSDLLPGGLEVENPRLNTAAAESDEDRDEHGLFIDLREDRLLVFFDRLEAGKARTFSYSLRAVSKGVFVLPPLAADAMYDPEISAVTGAGSLTVK